MNIEDLNRVTLSHDGGVTDFGTIKLEVGTLDHCQSQKGHFFSSFLKEHFEGFKTCPCEPVGMENYFVATF